MISFHQLEYLKKKLDELNEDRKKIESEIISTVDVTTRGTYENRLNLLFEKIEKKEQEINDLQSKLQGRSIDDLIEILQPISSQLQMNIMQAAYLSVLRHRGWKIQPDFTMPCKIVNYLSNIPKGQFDYEALHEFVAHLMSDLHEERALITGLRQWGEQQLGHRWADLLQQINQQKIRQAQQTQPALPIVISRADEASTQSQSDTYYHIKAWLIYDTQAYQDHQQNISPIIIDGMTGDETYISPIIIDGMTGNETYAQADLPHELPNLVSRFLAKIRDLLDKVNKEPELHICLPAELMNHEVDLWKLDEDGPVKPLLGRRYKVILRCTERWSRSYKQEKLWKKKWDRHKSLLEKIACDAFIEGVDDDLETLYYNLLEDTVVGLKVKQAPTSVGQNSLFGVLLQAGTPIAIWGRSNLQSTTNETELARILNLGCLSNLIDTVTQERKKARVAALDAHIGHHLSLLWDDPYLLPPKSA